MAILHRLFFPAQPNQGGQRLLLWTAIIVAQAAMVVLLLVEPILAFSLVGGLLLFVVALRHPTLAILGVLAARLISTNALSFHLGPVFISAFEPMYAMAFLAVVLRSIQDRASRLHDFPLARVLLALLVWALISLVWSPAKGDGLMVVVRIGIAFGLVWLLASEFCTLRGFENAIWTWLLVSCALGVAGLVLGSYGSAVYGDVEFQAMSGGGRIGGLGQHPNWFAMGLAFGINPAFAMAYAETNRWKRWTLAVIALWLLFITIATGSRGAVWGTAVGSVFLALHNARLRAFLMRYWIVVAVVFSVALLSGIGSFTSAFIRVATRGVSTMWTGDVRFSNWQVCWEMVTNTLGIGIGAGGYETLVPKYNDRLSLSQYVYPHGIVWDVMAHYGLVGLVLLGALGWKLMARTRRAMHAVRDTRVELWLIGMGAGVVGYWAHALVEFRLEDKPFWGFLGLLLGLIVAAERLSKDPEALEAYRRPNRPGR